MTVYDNSLKLHEKLHGKISVEVKQKIESREDLSLMYTPGVAQPCKEIYNDYKKSFTLTSRGNLVAVITDGTAVLGLGDIGPAAAMPVMEGKCALFKEFGDVDAFPICIDTKDTNKIINTIHLISKSFGGINLEDIAAPRCFEIEKRLSEVCDIPVFHDDQHGTAIVVAAALLNAIKVTNKIMGNLRIVINGAGAAGIAIANLIIDMGFGEIIMCDKDGILSCDEEYHNYAHNEIAKRTNPSCLHGLLEDAMKGADVVIGVSKPRVISKAMVASMINGIVFAMANPEPEIMPQDAIEAGASVVGTGRSDFANQINNVLVFPGIFKGALAVRAKTISKEMKIAAAYAIANMVSDAELKKDYIIPSALRKEVADRVAAAVSKIAIETGNTY